VPVLSGIKGFPEGRRTAGVRIFVLPASFHVTNDGYIVLPASFHVTNDRYMSPTIVTPFYRTRFFLVFPSTTTKPQSSNVIMSRVCVHCSSAFCFLLASLFFLLSYDEGSRPLPKVLDLRFSCFPSFMTSLLSNDYDITNDYDIMYDSM
jgi:hypothetical protein